jgi:hypothetical protein
MTFKGESRYETEAYCTFQGLWFPKDLVKWSKGKPMCPFCGYRARTEPHKQGQKDIVKLKQRIGRK